MACCEGRLNAYEVCSALFFTCSAIVLAIDGIGPGFSLLKDFPITVLERHVKVSRHLPVCVIYRKDQHGSKLEEIVYQLWVDKNETETDFSSWEVGAVMVRKTASGVDSVAGLHGREVRALPVFRCYLGPTAVHDYDRKPSRAGLRKWIQSLVNKQNKRLKEGTVGLVNEAAQRGSNVILGFTSAQHHELVEELRYQIADKQSTDREVFVTHHHSTESRPLQEQYSVNRIPAIVYHGKTADGSVVKKTFSDHDLDVKKLELFLTAMSIPARHVTMENFEAEVLEVREDYVPIMVCFYASWSNNSLPHLSTFERTTEELLTTGVKMRYGILDVAAEKAAVSRWVRASFAVHVPFTLLFHLSETRDAVVQSAIALSPSLPSPWRTYNRLMELGMNLTDHEQSSLKSVYPSWGLVHDNQVSHLFEGPWGWMCTPSSHNLTDTFPSTHRLLPLGEKNADVTNSLHNPDPHVQYDSGRLDSHLKMMHGIPILTSLSWEDIILRSHVSHHSLYPGGTWKGEVTKISLVIYVMEGCGSCRNNMHTFSKVKHDISFMEGGSVYMVNCTADRELCKDQGVTGFPTVSAYRGLGWLGAGQCVSSRDPTPEEYVRLDYHGVLLAQPILEWFLSLTVEAVHNKKFKLPPLPMIEDVRLVATLMPKLSRFLPIPPRRDYKYYLPYECFRLACERLFGQAKCYSVYSQDIPASEFASGNIKPIVAKVSLVRKDDVDLTLMLLGKSLLTTLMDPSFSRVHQYHTPHSHRYDLKPGQKCEDDHHRCTEFIVRVSRDHARLPVTQMTLTLFHTKNSLFSDASLPVLIAFVHRENITANSPFQQTLTSVGYELYNEVITVTVDVREFPGWVGQFVPLGYYSADDVGKVNLFVYPRLCLIYWSDHHRAGFYPPLDVDLTEPYQFTAEGIVDFARAAVKNPGVFMVDTEHF